MQLLFMFVLISSCLIGLTRPAFHGDAAEYALMTISIAQHGTPEIRQADAQLAAQLVPEFAWHYTHMLDHFAHQGPVPLGFLKAKDGTIRAIHSFGYSAIAAVPFKVLQLLGTNPMRCFLWVDAASLLLLAYSAYLYFGTAGRALFAVSVLIATAGFAYWNWASPELFCATLALSALLLMARSRYIPGGAILGLAGIQNPPLLALLFLGPLIVLAEQVANETSSSVRQIVGRQDWARMIVGAALGVTIGLLPVYFSLAYFDTWNVIATGATDRRLVNTLRLASYYLDFNQGMIIAIPGVLIVILLMMANMRRLALMFIPVVLTSLVLAVPALSTQNWNSGASGMMRYIAWGATPFLFLLLACTRQCRTWPTLSVALFFSIQIPFAAHATMYPHTDFSPLAQWVLRHAPQYYNPEPEIFVDRTTHAEPLVDFDNMYTYGLGDKRKVLYYAGSLKSMAKVCPQGLPKAESVVRASYDGWTYLNGKIDCGDAVLTSRTLGATELSRKRGGQALEGWSRFEFGREDQSGIWSIGEESSFVVVLPKGKADALTVKGIYMAGNDSTEVWIDGKSAGTWHLDRPNRIPLDVPASTSEVRVTLKHAAPRRPSAQDMRELAFFLKQVTVSYVGQ
jgi:hypothetical protein